MKTLLTFSLLILLAGCGSKGGGSGSSGADSATETPNPSASLVGDWISTCDSANGVSAQVTLAFTSDHLTTVVDTFSDAACVNPVDSLRQVVSYSTPAANQLNFVVISNGINNEVVGETYFTIFEVKDSVLYFGMQSAATSAGRPKAYDLSMGFKRK